MRDWKVFVGREEVTEIEQVYKMLSTEKRTLRDLNLNLDANVRERMRQLMLRNKPTGGEVDVRVNYRHLPPRVADRRMTREQIMAYYTVIVALADRLAQIELPEDGKICMHYEWRVSVFVMITYLVRCQSPKLDATADISPESLFSRIREMTNESLAVLHFTQAQMTQINEYVVKTARGFYQMQASFISEVVGLVERGSGNVLCDLGAWETLRISEPTGLGRSRCVITGIVCDAEELRTVHTQSYTGHKTQFAIHTHLAPYIEIAHVYLNFGLLLTQTTSHIRTNLHEWVETVCNIFIRCANELPHNFFSTVCALEAESRIDKFFDLT